VIDMALSRDPRGVLELGGVSLVSVAEAAGTPSYVYDLDAIAAEAKALDAAFDGHPHLVAYAVKANSAGRIVRTLIAAGCGADVVSGAELDLALRCGAAPDRIVYSGVAKTDSELDAALGAGEAGIGAIQVESVEEIPRIEARARNAGRIARVSLRINPGVDADDLETHSYIATGHDEAKFGVPLTSLAEALDRFASASSVRLVGLSAHVGSQLTSAEAYLIAARVLFGVIKQVRPRFRLDFVDTGGGFGIDYGEGCPARPADFIRATRKLQDQEGLSDLALYCEPGRSLVGSHGVLLARVIQRKSALARDGSTRRWTMIDAGMNDLMRPALYQARHRIVGLALPKEAAGAPSAHRVVGPVCESSDDFGTHDLAPPPEGVLDGVVVLDAGAYGYTMASRYNGRALPAEVFLEGGRIVAISPRRAQADWVSERVGAGA
jgi:diaminopimelate decarboxylase